MSADDKELAAALLNEYEQADAEVTRVKKILEEANKARSEVVKKLHNAFGKGPFSYKGKMLGKIVIRGNTYFFRAPREEGSVKVD